MFWEYIKKENFWQPQFQTTSFAVKDQTLTFFLPLLTLYLNLRLLFPSSWHLIPVYIPFALYLLTSLTHPHLPPAPGGFCPPCLTPLRPAEALTGMQKLCSSLCSNSVGSRNNDSRPTSPFRHHFLPHSQGKGPTQFLHAAPNKAPLPVHHVAFWVFHFLSYPHLLPLWMHDSHRLNLNGPHPQPWFESMH